MTFKDIKGHDEKIRALQQGILNERLAGAYLFTGPEGIGKALTALAFAASLNCRERREDSCGVCSSCLKIQKNQHPDLHIVDNGYSEDIKIEDIRRLQEHINLRPYEGRYKVFIINNCHNLNSVSANAFLKTLEEPPKHSIIIMVTDKPALLLNTIISRCQVIRFSALSRAALKALLKNDLQTAPLALHYIVRYCEGRVGCALKLKGRDILNEKNRIIDALTAENALRQDNFLIKDRDSLHAGLQILSGWFRDIYVLKAGMAEQELINIDRKGRLEELAAGYTFGQLDEILDTISSSLLYLEQNINLKLLISNLSIPLSLNH
ncbi:MAG: DNA polymerase III subunit delta' [Candidatus Omnitrophica bacterium]|jgi:DNA polymerase-3 subunit delta'|nr:DNA polymerase III subunit delta' [Candidatus Omnitrophota bacterium]